MDFSLNPHGKLRKRQSTPLSHKGTLPQKTVDLTRMNHDEDNHDQEHKQGIEHVKEHLVVHEKSVLAFDVFDDSKYGPDQDQQARSMQGVHVLAPGDVGRLGLRCRILQDARLEDQGAAEEETEEDDLDEETGDDNVPSSAHG